MMKAVRMLAKGMAKQNRGRAIVLAAAVALGILVLSTVFGISAGKVEAEELREIRANRTCAVTTLARATVEQYWKIKSLPYIQAVGRKYGAGSTLIYDVAGVRDGDDGEALSCVFTCLDKTAWEEMTTPAYTGIEGHYPREEGEIMLSIRALAALGMERPQMGQAISLKIQLGPFMEIEETFTLCGWFTDYVDLSAFPLQGYVSEAQVQKWGKSLDEPDELLIVQNDTLDAYELEERLNQDVTMRDKSQSFVTNDTFRSRAVNGLAGGYEMAALCGALILLCVFLLVYNVLRISMQKEVRQIGLLDTLGTTQKQIRRIYQCQIGRIVAVGGVIGVGASAMVGMVVLPYVVGGMYLYHYGQRTELTVWRPGLVVAAACFTALVVEWAAYLIIRKATRLTPLEAMHYQGEARRGGKLKRHGGKSGRHVGTKVIRRGSRQYVFHMAWRNLWRERRKFLLTAFSLFLGVVTVLVAEIIVRGTDYANVIEAEPDFAIGIECKNDGMEIPYVYEEYAPIREELKGRILSLEGVKADSVEALYGAFVIVDYAQEAFWPRNDALLSDGDYENALWRTYRKPEGEEGEPGFPDPAVVQIVDDDYLDKLERYVQENGLTADVDAVRRGEGVLFLHEGAWSEELREEADAQCGINVTFWNFLTKTEEEWHKRASMSVKEIREQESKGTWSAYPLAGQSHVSAYLDTRAKGFPQVETLSYDAVLAYFLISERGFEKLNVEKKMLSCQFDVEESYEEAAKAGIKEMIRAENEENASRVQDKKYGIDTLPNLFVRCKSDVLAEEQSYIRTNRSLFSVLGAALLLMGVMNYANVMVTGLFARRRELNTLERVGMTASQIRAMVTWEGAMYCGIVGALVLGVGNGMFYLVRWYMEQNVPHFWFYYPWDGMAVVFLLLAVVCAGVPRACFWGRKRDEKKMGANV